MIRVRALSAVIILSAAVATSAFAKEHGRAHDRFRKSYNQWSVPYDAPANGFGYDGTDRSWVGGQDPSRNPSGS